MFAAFEQDLPQVYAVDFDSFLNCLESASKEPGCPAPPTPAIEEWLRGHVQIGDPGQHGESLRSREQLLEAGVSPEILDEFQPYSINRGSRQGFATGTLQLSIGRLLCVIHAQPRLYSNLDDSKAGVFFAAGRYE